MFKILLVKTFIMGEGLKIKMFFKLPLYFIFDNTALFVKILHFKHVNCTKNAIFNKELGRISVFL